MPDAVDDAVDDVRVEPRQRAAERERAADEHSVVELVDVVLVLQQAVQEREAQPEPRGAREGGVLLVQHVGDEPAERGHGDR